MLGMGEDLGQFSENVESGLKRHFDKVKSTTILTCEETMACPV